MGGSDADDYEDSFSPNLFVDQTYVQKEFEFGAHKIPVYLLESAATDYDLTGQVIWPATWVLAKYILTHMNDFIGKAILEVGSGIGVTGLLAARISESNCVLTDAPEIVLDVLQKNIALNAPFAPKCTCMKLDWANEIDMHSVLQSNPAGFDIIIGSDVVYWQDAIIPLLNTIHKAKNTDDYLLGIGASVGFEIREIPLQSFIYEEVDNSKHVKTLIFQKRQK